MFVYGQFDIARGSLGDRVPEDHCREVPQIKAKLEEAASRHGYRLDDMVKQVAYQGGQLYAAYEEEMAPVVFLVASNNVATMQALLVEAGAQRGRNGELYFDRGTTNGRWGIRVGVAPYPGPPPSWASSYEEK